MRARWRDLATLPQRWSAPKFPLKAADFIARGIAEGPLLGQVLALAEDAWLAADFPLDDLRSTPSPTRPSPASPATQAVSLIVLPASPTFRWPARCWLRRRAAGLRGRRPRGLRHRRADAAGAGAADRRRAGGADHRDLGDLHQYQPRRRLSPLCRLPPRADRDRCRGADHRARRLWLYAAHQRRRGAGDRHHADPERAAAPACSSAATSGSATPGSPRARSATAWWSAAPRARA